MPPTERLKPIAFADLPEDLLTAIEAGNCTTSADLTSVPAPSSFLIVDRRGRQQWTVQLERNEELSAKAFFTETRSPADEGLEVAKKVRRIERAAAPQEIQEKRAPELAQNQVAAEQQTSASTTSDSGEENLQQKLFLLLLHRPHSASELQSIFAQQNLSKEELLRLLHAVAMKDQDTNTFHLKPELYKHVYPQRIPDEQERIEVCKLAAHILSRHGYSQLYLRFVSYISDKTKKFEGGIMKGMLTEEGDQKEGTSTSSSEDDEKGEREKDRSERKKEEKKMSLEKDQSRSSEVITKYFDFASIQIPSDLVKELEVALSELQSASSSSLPTAAGNSKKIFPQHTVPKNSQQLFRLARKYKKFYPVYERAHVRAEAIEAVLMQVKQAEAYKDRGLVDPTLLKYLEGEKAEIEGFVLKVESVRDHMLNMRSCAIEYMKMCKLGILDSSE